MLPARLARPALFALLVISGVLFTSVEAASQRDPREDASNAPGQGVPVSPNAGRAFGQVGDPAVGAGATDEGAASDEESKSAEPRGLTFTSERATPGYVLFSPLTSGSTYLIDADGQVVHTWTSEYSPGGSVYLLDNGNLLRTAREHDFPRFKGGGQAGRIEEFSWDGERLWTYVLADDQRLSHHDIERLPNGNILVIAWESKSRQQALEAGRRPDRIAEDGLWPCMLLEIEPTPPEGGKIVWEWHTWDHLIQDTDKRFGNYGEPARHPELVDINGEAPPPEYSGAEVARLRALGYLAGGDDGEPPDVSADWMHTNAVAYNAELDQIALSVRRFHEIWILDHSTSTEEAAGHTGGRWGRGGDLLWRWGNPRTYGRGTLEDQQLFGQHDVRWIPEGFPGAGQLMVFNNGTERPDGKFSQVFTLIPSVDRAGRYVVPETGPFGPDAPRWIYESAQREDFHSDFISGAHRLPNGNTFICEGATGRFFEVDADGHLYWEYKNPFIGDIRTADGNLPQPGLDATPVAVFRATKILPDDPSLAGRELVPLDPQPEFSELPPPPPPGADGRPHGPPPHGPPPGGRPPGGKPPR